jgi:hypothetical protein
MRGDGGEVPQIHLCRRAGFVVGETVADIRECRGRFGKTRSWRARRQFSNSEREDIAIFSMNFWKKLMGV